MNIDENDEIIDWGEEDTMNSENNLTLNLNIQKSHPNKLNYLELDSDELNESDAYLYSTEEMNENEDIKNDKNTTNTTKVSSIDISQLNQKKLPNGELVRINKSLKKLEQTIHSYMDNSKMIWDELFCPFMNSGDCMILENMSDNDYNTFWNFMKEQQVFRLIVTAFKRLLARRDYILNNMNSAEDIQ